MAQSLSDRKGGFMMTCRDFERLGSARSLGDLSPAARTHLSSCQACAAKAQTSSSAHTAQPMTNADSAREANRFSRRGLLKTGVSGLLAGLTMKVRRSFG